MCEPKASVPVRVPAAAVAALAGAAACVWAASLLAPLAAAVALTIAAVDVAGLVVLRHTYKYGRGRKPRPVRATVSAKVYWEGSVLPWRQAAIEAPRLAIENRPVLTGTVLARTKEAVR